MWSFYSFAKVCSVNSDINFQFFINQWSHTIRNMFLMRSVDCYTFLTVSVITTGLSGKDSDLCLYTPYEIPLQILLAVSAPRHGFPYEILPLHPVLSGSLQSSCYYSASISTIPSFSDKYDLLLTLLYFIAYRKDSIFYETCRLGTACNARCPQMASPQKGSWRQPAQGSIASLYDLEQTMTAKNHSPPARSLRERNAPTFGWL